MYITGWQGPEKCEHEPTTTYCADEILIYLSNMFNMFKMSLVYVLCRWHPQHVYIPLHADTTSQGALCRPHNTQLQFDRILCHSLFGITQSYSIPMGFPKGFRRPAHSLLLWAPKMLNCQVKLDRRKYTL